MRRVIILQIFLTSGWIENSWIHIPASAFNLLSYVSLVEVDEENLGSLRYAMQLITTDVKLTDQTF